MDFGKMTKYQRMQFLETKGLNIPEAILVLPESLGVEEGTFGKEFLNFMRGRTHASLRTVPRDPTKGDMKTPHYPNTPKKDVIPRILTLLEEGYNVIVQEPIDPKNTKWCGAIEIRDDGTIYVEIADNPNREAITVRRVVIEGKIDRKECITAYENPKDPEIRSAVDAVRKTGMYSAIFEVSWYHTKHGIRNQHLIWWEVRNSGV